MHGSLRLGSCLSRDVNEIRLAALPTPIHGIRPPLSSTGVDTPFLSLSLSNG
jgi:hypothetical protein